MTVTTATAHDRHVYDGDSPHGDGAVFVGSGVSRTWSA
jgi:hypothetical protein